LEVHRFVDEWQSELKELADCSFSGKKVGVSTQYLLMIPDEKWSKPTIDQTLALYLIDIADLSKTIQKSRGFYKNVVCLVQLFRDCVKEQLKTLFGEVIASQKGADCVPLYVNDFLSSYLPLKCNIINPEFATKMVHHLCQWLFNRNLTNFRLEYCVIPTMVKTRS